jgi:hypothetical protein
MDFAVVQTIPPVPEHLCDADDTGRTPVIVRLLGAFAGKRIFCVTWGGLAEIAAASRVGLTIEKGEIILQETVRKVCGLYDIDPYSSISEGTLILTVRPHRADEVRNRLNDKGILASIVGEVVEIGKGTRYFDGGREYTLEHPKVDPFWAAFGKAASER